MTIRNHPNRNGYMEISTGNLTHKIRLDSETKNVVRGMVNRNQIRWHSTSGSWRFKESSDFSEVSLARKIYCTYKAKTSLYDESITKVYFNNGNTSDFRLCNLTTKSN